MSLQDSTGAAALHCGVLFGCVLTWLAVKHQRFLVDTLLFSAVFLSSVCVQTGVKEMDLLYTVTHT
jgi:hypothetical protein